MELSDFMSNLVQRHKGHSSAKGSRKWRLQLLKSWGRHIKRMTWMTTSGPVAASASLLPYPNAAQNI